MLDIDFYTKKYFYWDKPCIYKKGNHEITIYPIKLEDSEEFLNASSVLSIDKDSLASVDIIQMSYLSFIVKVLFKQNKTCVEYLSYILKKCLDMDNPKIGMDSHNKKMIFDDDKDIFITEKEFEDVRRLILYQNILSYDDSYIDPDLKNAIMETNRLRNRDIDFPDVERRMAIITSHCGLTKEYQQNMTYRAHSKLFKEICGDVDFNTTRSIALLNGKDLEHWIYKKKKDKYSDYIMTLEDYNKSMGGDGNVADGKIRASKNMPQDGAALDAMFNMHVNSK